MALETGNHIMVDPLLLGSLGAIVSMLLAIIAFFLSRLVAKVDALGNTLANFDRDVTSKIEVLQERTRHTDVFFGRLRDVEDELTSLKAGGCEHLREHMKDHLRTSQ